MGKTTSGHGKPSRWIFCYQCNILMWGGTRGGGGGAGWVGGRVYGRVIWYPPTSRQNSNILRDNASDIKIVDNTRRYGSLCGPYSSSCKGIRPLAEGKNKYFLCCFWPISGHF
jgi:hypothetical protein